MTGQALIRDPHGNVWVGETVLHRGIVTILSPRRRCGDKTYECGHAALSWPGRAVQDIVWVEVVG